MEGTIQTNERWEMTKIWMVMAATLVGLIAVQFPVAARQAAPGASFVAQTQNPQAFVALVTSGDKVLAYVCDGQKIAEWFRGRVENGRVSLVSTGGASRLEATFASGVWDGAVSLESDRRWAFRTSGASAPAGLYRSDDVLNGARYLGGWIVLNNGEQRGAVIGDGSTRPGARLIVSAARPSTSLANVGSLLPFLVTPEFVDSIVQ